MPPQTPAVHDWPAAQSAAVEQDFAHVPPAHALPIPQSVLVEQERTHTPPEHVALAYFEQSELEVQVCAEAATWHTPSSQLRRPGKALQSALTVLALHWFAFVSTMSEHDVSAAKHAAAAPPTTPRRRSRPHALRPPHVCRRP